MNDRTAYIYLGLQGDFDPFEFDAKIPTEVT